MTTSRPVVVVIEDEPAIRQVIRTGLSSHGYEVHESDGGKLGLIEAATRKPDLVILDLGLPDMDGVEVVKQLRSWTAMPIIILSARAMDKDKIAALDAGADDYLTKPFSMGELLARLRVSLRHAALVSEDKSSVFEVGGPERKLRVDLAHRRVLLDGTEVHLTPIEYRLLSVLVKQAGKVVTHRQLLKDVWGPGHVDRPHYLRIYMGCLRAKLEADPARPRFLHTETGVGYRLAAE